MKILKIDHLGLAVSDIDENIKFWADTLGLEFGGVQTVEDQHVKTAHFKVGESKIELLESTSESGPVSKFLDKKGPGVHHIALHVENLVQALDELKQKKIKLIDSTPRKGADGNLIAFIHPEATPGVLVELCEKTK